MSEIFISYARSTASQAQAVVEALRALGYGVWLDNELPAHRVYGDVIDEHLRAAKAVLVIWSNEAVKSDWVRSEANAAREARKLVQLSVDGAKLPMPFDQIQCANLAGWNGDLTVPGWRKVIASIVALTGGPVVTIVQTTQPPVRKNSICVLPFLNMSGDAEQEYFSDGISEDIITDLSKVSALLVIARNTAFTFKAKSVDVSHVALQLNVSHVLEGSVRKSGERVRITAQLIDGATGGHVWAERYDRDLHDIFALQDEIAAAIVRALKLKLLPGEKRSLERRGTNNLEAYDLYLRGTRPAVGPEQQQERLVVLEAATRLAPDYADAWGELAKVRQFLYWRRPYGDRPELAKVILAEIERALALDPHNIAALGAQFYLAPPGRPLDEQALIARMVEIAPFDADVLNRQAHHLSGTGQIRAAIDVARQAAEIDPLDPLNGYTAQLWNGGRYAEARRGFEETLARWPDHQYSALNLVMLCIHTQDWATVDALLAPDRLAQGPLKGFEWLPWYASVFRNRSRAWRRQPIESARKRFEDSGTAEFFLLQIAAQAGAADEAHAIGLQARFGPAAGTPDEMGYGAYRPHGLFVSHLSELRRDPRFVKLCARCGFVDYWMTTQHWPDCVDEVAAYYDFKAECAKVAAGPPLPPANESGAPSVAV